MSESISTALKQSDFKEAENLALCWAKTVITLSFYAKMENILELLFIEL